MRFRVAATAWLPFASSSRAAAKRDRAVSSARSWVRTLPCTSFRASTTSPSSALEHVDTDGHLARERHGGVLLDRQCLGRRHRRPDGQTGRRHGEDEQGADGRECRRLALKVALPSGATDFDTGT
jgi:hypothetical protein